MKPEAMIVLRYALIASYVFLGGWKVIQGFLGKNKGMVRTRPSSFRFLVLAIWFVGLALVFEWLMPRP